MTKQELKNDYRKITENDFQKGKYIVLDGGIFSEIIGTFKDEFEHELYIFLANNMEVIFKKRRGFTCLTTETGIRVRAIVDAREQAEEWQEKIQSEWD